MNTKKTQKNKPVEEEGLSAAGRQQRFAKIVAALLILALVMSIAVPALIGLVN